MHSLGGGTGSGLGALTITKLKERYPDRIVLSFSVFPSAKVSDVVTEPYNAILAANKLINHADEVVVLDNEALYNICTRKLKMPASYDSLNHLISASITGVTASLRFPSFFNSSLRKIAVNMVPYKRLHFFSVGLAPLIQPGQTLPAPRATLVPELTTQIFDANHMVSGANMETGRHLAASCLFRGALPPPLVHNHVATLRDKYPSAFVEWVPNNTKYSIDLSFADRKTSATYMGNSTGIQEVFKRTVAGFAALYRKKAFLHFFKGEGMDELEFQNAEKNVHQLIKEYQEKQDAKAEAVGEFDEKEEEDDF